MRTSGRWPVLFLLAMVTAASAVHAVITPITIGDFNNPIVLDFESVPLGDISGTDPAFTGFGISLVTGTGSDSDPIWGDIGPDTGRALFVREDGTGQLFISQFGAGDRPAEDSVTFSIELAESHVRFGVSLASLRIGDPTDLTFFDGPTVVGTITVTRPDASEPIFYFESDVVFDEVLIEHPVGNQILGLDNITLDQSSVPALGPLPMGGLTLLLVLLGLGALRLAGRGIPFGDR